MPFGNSNSGSQYKHSALRELCFSPLTCVFQSKKTWLVPLIWIFCLRIPLLVVVAKPVIRHPLSQPGAR